MKIGTIFGIPVCIHWTLLAFAGLFGLAEGLYGLRVLACLFGSILFHEFGHCFAARWYGRKTQEVVLYPFGGVARTYLGPTLPWQAEFIIALAGPAVSATLYGFGTVANLEVLAWINIVLMLFNLLPVFPMDGGRVLRSLLWSRLGYVRGTFWAVRTGQTLACLLVPLAVWYEFYVAAMMLVFIAILSQQEIHAAGLWEGVARFSEALAEVAPSMRVKDLKDLEEVLQTLPPDLRDMIRVEELLPLIKEIQQET